MVWLVTYICSWFYMGVLYAKDTLSSPFLSLCNCLMLFRGLTYKGLLWNVEARWKLDDLYTHWHAHVRSSSPEWKKIKWCSTNSLSCDLDVSKSCFSFPLQNGRKSSLFLWQRTQHEIANGSTDHVCCVTFADFVRECIIGTGLNYKGRRSVTESGVECQNWDMNTPHEHQ